jgi:hypothetical protein
MKTWFTAEQKRHKVFIGWKYVVTARAARGGGVSGAVLLQAPATQRPPTDRNLKPNIYYHLAG